MSNISTAFRYNKSDAKLLSRFMSTDPNAQFEVFKSISSELTDHAYWFLLSTMWVNESQIAPISDWKNLFSARRANRNISIMKPNELAAFKALPNKLTLYRAQKANEVDWISYTLDKETALKFARIKDTGEVNEYKVKKYDCLALFLRRGETEIICLDKEKVKLKGNLTAKE